MKFRLKNSSGGMTLVEVVVVLFVVGLFSLILISDFPKILRQFALSRATYKLAQDFRRVENLGLSGVKLTSDSGISVPVKGFGIYIDTNESATEYTIYADVADATGNSNQKYDESIAFCSQLTEIPTADCIIEKIDISQENQNLRIQPINNISGTSVSINFNPPNPTISITDGSGISSYSEVGITLGLISDSSNLRTVSVNQSGLISIQ